MGIIMKKETVIKAIEGSGGIIATVSRRLNCQWHTADKYIHKWKETETAFENEMAMILDMAEGVLFNSVKEGNVQAAKWVLATLGKRRGYSEKYELEHNGYIKILPAPKPKQTA